MPYAEFDEVRLHIRQAGSGPVALFVHGFPLDSSMWIDQLSALSEVRRCIAVDLRGFGRSSSVNGSPLRMEVLADDLAAVLDLVSEEKADIIGFSMGGYAALAFAEIYPKRMRTLALVDTKSGADSAEGKAGRDAMAQKLVTDGRTAIAELMQSGLLGPQPSVAAQARLRTMIENCPYETIVGALGGMRDRSDRTGVLGTIDVPAAVIVGEDDGVTPPVEAEAMAAAIRDATLTIVAESGHMSPIEQPAAVNDALLELFSRV